MAKVGIEVSGAGETMSMLRGMASRCKRPAGAFEQVFRAFEANEREIFEGYGGKYQDTGATMRSLTQPEATGAIREAHGGEFVFGTSIWYAKFQGTTGKGRHHDPSAIVKFTPELAFGVRKGLQDWIHPRDAAGRFVSVLEEGIL
jgi:hypothetical protein